MCSAYAAGTTVTAERSRSELEKTLRRFGATQFVYGWSPTEEKLGFDLHDRSVRIDLPLPDRHEFITTPGGRRRTVLGAQDAYDAEVRRRWRSLVLVIKAKLAAIADGISTVEREFLADVVLPSGETFSEWVAPQLSEIASRGLTPALLPGATR